MCHSSLCVQVLHFARRELRAELVARNSGSGTASYCNDRTNSKVHRTSTLQKFEPDRLRLLLRKASTSIKVSGGNVCYPVSVFVFIVLPPSSRMQSSGFRPPSLQGFWTSEHGEDVTLDKDVNTVFPGSRCLPIVRDSAYRQAWHGGHQRLTASLDRCARAQRVDVGALLKF